METDWKDLPTNATNLREYVARLYAYIAEKFWNGDFDHLTAMQMREQLRLQIGDEIYESYLAYVRETNGHEHREKIQT